MIVVAEADLGHADRVVFVDDGQNVPFEKSQNRVAHIKIAGPIVEISSGQQNLGGVCVMLFQTLLIGPHQETLPDCCTGLQVAQIGGPFRQPQPPHAGADGPRTDQHDFAARLPDAMDLIGQELQPGRVEQTGFGGQHVGADLDDHGVGLGDDFLANGIDHGIPFVRRLQPRLSQPSLRE